MHSILYINPMSGVPRNKFWKTSDSLVLLTLLGDLHVTLFKHYPIMFSGIFWCFKATIGYISTPLTYYFLFLKQKS